MAIDVIECTSDFTLDENVLLSAKPIVLRGLVGRWPVVIEAQRSDVAAMDYLKRWYNGRPVTVVQGDPQNRGRVAYSNDLSKLNCVSRNTTLPEALELMTGEDGSDNPFLYYIGTTFTDAILPGFREQNTLELGRNADQFIWLGNRSCIPAHFDLPDNIACNVVGRRRFTLFPPEQLDNLYVGPLDFTPAGQSISLVDIRNPDYARFPKYRAAEESAIAIVLEPGDALFIPSMWWHHVEGLDRLNVLINYWWRQTPAFMSSPADVLDLALLAVRDLPAEQKNAWKSLLDYYVFNDDAQAFDHIPEAARGSIGTMNDTVARKIRAKILSRLNR